MTRALIAIFALAASLLPPAASRAGGGGLGYPQPPTDGTVDTYYGSQVPDPYRPLESIDAPATRAWVEAESALARNYYDRVFPAHSFKFAAKMQADQAGSAPILLRVQLKAGHGGSTTLAQSIDSTADIYAFLVKNLGMTLPADFASAAGTP